MIYTFAIEREPYGMLLPETAELNDLAARTAPVPKTES